MAICKINKFQTSDGKVFDDKGVAKQHESELQALRELATILQESLSTGRIDSIMRQLLMEEVMVRKILGDYHKRQPKQEELLSTLPKAA